MKMVNDLMTVDQLDDEALLALAGGSEVASQGDGNGMVYARINYDDDHGPRGTWKIKKGDQVIFSDTIVFRPLVRTFEWSVWDQEVEKITCRSVQRPGLGDSFPDTSGGYKCGRLSKAEEEALGENHPDVLASRSATCTQILYGYLTMPEAQTKDGKKTVPAEVENQIAAISFKKSGFRPIGDFINGLLKQKKTLQRQQIEISTEKKKMGSVNYFVPNPRVVGETDVTPEDKETIVGFLQKIKEGNDAVMEANREATKLMLSDADADLSADFEAAE
jgi:hypothetical protein